MLRDIFESVSGGKFGNIQPFLTKTEPKKLYRIFNSSAKSYCRPVSFFRSVTGVKDLIVLT